jgi:hypothetical protein
MAVPAVAWLTRSCLTNEPAAARACLAAAGEARRCQLSVLLVALLGGWLLVVAGTFFEVIVSKMRAGSPGPWGVTGAGLVAGLVCAVIGTAIAAVCNPPVLRRPGSAELATVTLVVLALASSRSPAAAAIHQAAPIRGSHVPVVPGLAAVVAGAVAWYTSIVVAAHRS